MTELKYDSDDVLIVCILGGDALRCVWLFSLFDMACLTICLTMMLMTRMLGCLLKHCLLCVVGGVQPEKKYGNKNRSPSTLERCRRRIWGTVLVPFWNM